MPDFASFLLKAKHNTTCGAIQPKIGIKLVAKVHITFSEKFQKS